MDNGLYINLSRQLALFREMDVTANNIANANSTGYNAEHITFASYLSKDVNQGETNPMSFAHDVSTFRDLESGPLEKTDNPLDLAISGHGYFAVQTPLGVRYTRAGNFQIDGTGLLTDSNGYPVLDPSNQQIVFPDNVNSIDVGSVGNVKVNGDDFGSIGVMQFENEQSLRRLGNGLLTTDATPVAAENVTVLQGVREGSNVKPVLEMTHMIDISRAVGTTAKYLEAVYELQRKATNVWAQQG